MRVVMKEKLHVFHGHQPVYLEEGQEVSGSLAAMLLKQAPGKVTPLDQPEPEPAELDITAPAPKVLAWVGEDPARAAESLAAEQARDKPRSTLVAALTKLTEKGEQDGDRPDQDPDEDE